MTLHRNWRLWSNKSSFHSPCPSHQPEIHKLKWSRDEDFDPRSFWSHEHGIRARWINPTDWYTHSYSARKMLLRSWNMNGYICFSLQSVSWAFTRFFLLSNNEVENIVLATFVDCHSGSVQFDSDTSRVVDGSTLQIPICILTLVTIQKCRRPLPYFFPLLLNKSITEKCSSQSIILPLSRSISMLSSLHAQVGSSTQIANNQLQDLWTKFIFSASNGRTAQLFPHQVAIATSCLLLQLCQSSPAIDLPM